MRDLHIACGGSRQAKKWTNKIITFDKLKDRLRVTLRTPESAEEYARMNKGDRDQAKDHGGFVAGSLIGGRRTVDAVDSRSMLTLDGDRITPDFLREYPRKMPWASVLYSTHSHTPENPRVRIVIPLTRDVTPEEFAAVSRYMAQELGMDYFDECSYLPNQMMYWPTTPMNGEYVFLETEGLWLNPDDTLWRHPEWTDPTRLPTSGRESQAKPLPGKKAQDPLTKEGAVGLFNRTYYPVQKALDAFLGEVYEPTDNPNRYHFIASSSMPGVEIKEDAFVYSHHAKDPAYLKLCNAFDIVRIHLFGNGDEKASFQKMCAFALSRDEVKLRAVQERQASAVDDFQTDDFQEEDGGGHPENAPGKDENQGNEWLKRLDYDSRTGKILNNLHNITLILQHDPLLKHIVFNQLADGLEIIGPVPWQHPGRFWRDADDAQLVSYIDSHYGTFSARNYEIAVTKVADDRSYHPIREMFDSLPPWDGTPRVDTLLIDYLGAADNAYVRAVTRKALCAAYARIYHPGIKFDYMLVLSGAQGIGKSTIIAKLGMDWFSDSLSLSDMNDKTAAEKLQGYWIMEIGELAGMKKADIDKVKAFVSRQDDKYRASFGRRVTPHPRQCVLIGSTNNESGYLRDVTGNRRFWNVSVTGRGRFRPWELDEDTIRQVWAEVKVLAQAGEKLYLPADIETMAKGEQMLALEEDERAGLVSDYLETLLPANWNKMDLFQRREYLRDPGDVTRPKGTQKRTTVSNIEIWCECFCRNKEDLRPTDSYAISAIMMKMSRWQKSNERKILPIYGQQRVYTRIW